MTAWPEDRERSSWDGKERRQRSQEDHDLLIEIHTYSRSMLESFKSHVATDLKQFEDTNKRIAILEKCMYGCIGALTVLQVVLKFVH